MKTFSGEWWVHFIFQSVMCTLMIQGYQHRWGEWMVLPVFGYALSNYIQGLLSAKPRKKR